MLENNLAARRFHEAMGGLLHATRPDHIGQTEIITRVCAWPDGLLRTGDGKVNKP